MTEQSEFLSPETIEFLQQAEGTGSVTQCFVELYESGEYELRTMLMELECIAVVLSDGTRQAQLEAKDIERYLHAVRRALRPRKLND